MLHCTISQLEAFVPYVFLVNRDNDKMLSAFVTGHTATSNGREENAHLPVCASFSVLSIDCNR